MSGAVGSPFTASMFRFDGLRILAVFIYVNTFSILLWCSLPITLSIKGIYFPQTKNSRTEQGGIVSEVRSGVISDGAAMRGGGIGGLQAQKTRRGGRVNLFKQMLSIALSLALTVLFQTDFSSSGFLPLLLDCGFASSALPASCSALSSAADGSLACDASS